MPEGAFNMSTQTLSDLLSVAQVADELNCSTDTVRRMIARGELRAFRYGSTSRLIRIDRRDLDRLRTPVTMISDVLGSGDAA